jgi:hypothetical protein
MRLGDKVRQITTNHKKREICHTDTVAGRMSCLFHKDSHLCVGASAVKGLSGEVCSWCAYLSHVVRCTTGFEDPRCRQDCEMLPRSLLFAYTGSPVGEGLPVKSTF